MAIVGAAGDDDVANNSGAAYLFDTTDGSLIAKLKASDIVTSGEGFPDDYFGHAVGVSNDFAIVGAWATNEGSRAAYLFDTSTGEEITQLQPYPIDHEDGSIKRAFGYDVAISDDYAVVGTSNSNFGTDEVFIFDTRTGEQIAEVNAANLTNYDFFRPKVSISDDFVLVGSQWDDNFTGSAHLFSASTGLHIHEFIANDAEVGDQFGVSVALEGNIAVVGSAGYSNSNNSERSAYFFDVTSGKQLGKITASDPFMDDRFGSAVGIGNDQVTIGAWGVDPPYIDEFGFASTVRHGGAAYIFDIISVPEPTAINMFSVMLLIGLGWIRIK